MRRRSFLLMTALAAPVAAGVRARAAEAKKDGKEGKEGEGESGPKKKGGGGISFVQLPTLNATLLKPGGRRGVLTVEAGLDVPDAMLRDRASASVPRLRDAYVRFLQAYAATAGSGAPPNPDLIEAALQRATDQVLGKPGARFLLGTVLIN